MGQRLRLAAAAERAVHLPRPFLEGRGVKGNVLSSRDRELRPTPIVIISFSQARGQQAFAGRSVSPSRSTAR